MAALTGQNEPDGVLPNFGGSNAPNLSATPKPGSLATTALAASGLLARRRTANRHAAA